MHIRKLNSLTYFLTEILQELYMIKCNLFLYYLKDLFKKLHISDKRTIMFKTLLHADGSQGLSIDKTCMVSKKLSYKFILKFRRK